MTKPAFRHRRIGTYHIYEWVELGRSFKWRGIIREAPIPSGRMPASNLGLRLGDGSHHSIAQTRLTLRLALRYHVWREPWKKR